MRMMFIIPVIKLVDIIFANLTNIRVNFASVVFSTVYSRGNSALSSTLQGII